MKNKNFISVFGSLVIALATFAQNTSLPTSQLKEEAYYNRQTAWNDAVGKNITDLTNDFGSNGKSTVIEPLAEQFQAVTIGGVKFDAGVVRILFSKPGSPNAVVGANGKTLWEDTIGNAGTVMLQVTFTTPVYAVGFKMANGCNAPCSTGSPYSGNGGNISITLSNGVSHTYPGKAGFFGVRSNKEIAQLLLTSSGNDDNNIVEIADFMYSTSKPAFPPGAYQ
jgi:hypothetical protein